MNIIQSLTESQWFTAIMKSLGGEGVPTETWTGKRHPGLAWSKFLGRALGVFDGFATQLENSLFLQTATGLGLRKFSRSQYQLEPFPAQPQIARFTLRSAAGSPDTTAAAGDIVVGQLGGSLEWTSEGFTLVGGGKAVVLFTATGSGPEWNLPVNSALELRTTIVGARVTNEPVGQATALGIGSAGLYLYAAQEGVTVEVVNGGASQPLTVTGNLGSKLVTISPATDAGSVITSTAEEVRAAIVSAVSATGVPQLLAWAKNISGGGAGLIVASSPVAMSWTGSYIEQAGAAEESEDSLKARDLTRFMGLGGWAGDGAPPSPVATDEGLEFWARTPTAPRRRPPVVGVKVLSNYYAGLPSGKDITVIVWGALGQLSASELAAVDSNFYGGRKFSIGSDLHTVTVTNVILQLQGSVDVRLDSGLTAAEVLAAIAARMALYQQNTRAIFPGCTLRPVILEARIADALPDQVIDNVTLTNPAADVPLTFLQYPLIDPSQLVVNFVP